jgi:hypothetical protein
MRDFQEGFFNREQHDYRSNLERAYKKAMEFLNGQAIKPEEFTDVYSAEEIGRDQRWVEDMEKKFESQRPDEMKQLATVLEAVIHQGINNAWLSLAARPIRASRFDDYKNGADEFIAFDHPDGTSYMALAVDATIAISYTDKIRRIRDEILKGTLTEAKYFADEDEDYRPGKKKMARVVFETDLPMMSELMRIWLANDNNELARHPVQLKILFETIEQLQVYRDFAEYAQHSELLEFYDNILSRLIQIREEKIKELDYYQSEIFRRELDLSIKGLRGELKIVFPEVFQQEMRAAA